MAGVPHPLVWRIALGTGALPSLSVKYLRRRVPVTARYLVRIAGDNAAAESVIASVDQSTHNHTAWEESMLRDQKGFGYYFATHAREFIIASVLWFLFDIVGYAGNLFGPSLLAKGIGLTTGTFGLVMFAVFSLPGKALAIGPIDRWGRKPLQVWGSVGWLLSSYSLRCTVALSPFHCSV
ncbi:MFS transporter [Sulfobacillus thermotolerans]